MKKYKFIYPVKQSDGTIVIQEEILSEQEILDNTLDFWLSQIKTSDSQFAKEMRQKCIDDYIVVNWGLEVNE